MPVYDINSSGIAIKQKEMYDVNVAGTTNKAKEIYDVANSGVQNLVYQLKKRINCFLQNEKTSGWTYSKSNINASALLHSSSRIKLSPWWDGTSQYVQARTTTAVDLTGYKTLGIRMNVSSISGSAGTQRFGIGLASSLKVNTTSSMTIYYSATAVAGDNDHTIDISSFNGLYYIVVGINSSGTGNTSHYYSEVYIE